MKVAIIGAGGVGCLLAAHLAQTGNDILFVCRGDNLRTIQQSGLVVKKLGGQSFTVKNVRAVEVPSEHVDVVFLCVKTYDTEGAMKHLPPLMGDETVVLSLQNGLESDDHISKAVGHQRVMGALTYCSAHLEAPGVIIDGAIPCRIVFGENDDSRKSDPKRRAHAEKIKAMLEQAGIITTLHEDIQVARWEKLGIIAGPATLTALCRVQRGIVTSTPETNELATRIMKECIAVGRAKGVRLDENTLDRMLASSAKAPPTHKSSLFVDMLNGRRLELEQLNGTIVRMGKEVGIDTPYNFAVYAALKPYLNGPPPPVLPS